LILRSPACFCGPEDLVKLSRLQLRSIGIAEHGLTAVPDLLQGGLLNFYTRAAA
jgi:hypothetical protein